MLGFCLLHPGKILCDHLTNFATRPTPQLKNAGVQALSVWQSQRDCVLQSRAAGLRVTELPWVRENRIPNPEGDLCKNALWAREDSILPVPPGTKAFSPVL